MRQLSRDIARRRRHIILNLSTIPVGYPGEDGAEVVCQLTARRSRSPFEQNIQMGCLRSNIIDGRRN